ncbi:TB2/DP1, HVA22 family-domain-containing protein [Chytriomyces sp. MP71]|nr:TB2/DP1, HVA22 family-domain-containing protein [Chytriomyces sp. MP71]
MSPVQTAVQSTDAHTFFSRPATPSASSASSSAKFAHAASFKAFFAAQTTCAETDDDPAPHGSTAATVPGAFPFSVSEAELDSDATTATDEAGTPVSAAIARQAEALAIHRDLRFLARYTLSLARIVRVLELRLRRFPILVHIHKTYDVSPLLQASVLVVVGMAIVRRAMKTNARLVSNVIGALYPALQSVLAIERPRADDDEKLLTYWSLFGLFSVLDHAAPQIQLLYPAYFSTKMSILYWIYARGGASKLYNTFYRPLLVKYFGYPARTENAAVQQN